MQILAISGSLRARSSNTAVLTAAGLLAPPGVDIALWGGLGGLPLFNPDQDDDPPPAALEFRRRIGACQGLLICTPEYAGGVAGAMKNALDWLVGSLEFPQKPVALINASPRASLSDGQIRVTLNYMSARLVEPASITLPLSGRNLDAAGIAADPALSAQLRGALDVFAQAIAAMEDA